MGALAPPVSPWIPEDDLLLKNAIEAGASSESLAKGAVQFSRKFTVRELQERWHSLLYDPVVSEEASSRMIEFEHTASTLYLKFGRTVSSKDNKSLSGKRKSESVHNCYYALCKKIQNEPLDSMDLSFLIVPNDDNYGIGDEPLPGNYKLGNLVSDHFGVQESNMSILDCSFPQIFSNNDTATRDSWTNRFQTTIRKQDDDFPAEPVNIHDEIPDILGENQFLLENGSGIEELRQPKEFPVHSLFEGNDIMDKPSSTFDQINNVPENICSEFEGNQVFNSLIVECGLPIWRTDEGLSTSTHPADDGHGEEDLQTGDIYSIRGDDVAKSNHESDNDVGTDCNLKPAMPCKELENPIANTEGYLVEISNTLMNDEPFFMDVGAKDVIDKSYFDGLSSLLTSSPNNADQDQMRDIIGEFTSENLDNLVELSHSKLREVNEVGVSCTVDGNSEVLLLSSASTSGTQFPELTNGIIICILNTEDPEVPCNEDVNFVKQLCPLVVSSKRQGFEEGGYPLSVCVKEFSGGNRTSEGGLFLDRRYHKDPGQSHGTSQMKVSQVTPKMNQIHPASDCRVKFGDSPHFAPRNEGFEASGSASMNPINVNKGSLPPKEKWKKIILGKHLNHSADSLIPDSNNCHPLVNSSAIKQELDAPEMIKDHQVSNAESVSMNIISPETVVDHPPPDVEDLLMESDGDVPRYSDIESMILDMDLDPDDQDLCDQKVARYLHEDAKREIIRLEQGAHSYIQRAIASHGALAILYGRYSKHFIKKPEILLGRTTEDFVVDIDLGREGCANKVSRRQAIIKMKKDGSFHLRNLGKCSVSINSKEVAPGQSLGLSPSCLIEIRGMPFIFETNQTRVKSIEWSPKKKNKQNKNLVMLFKMTPSCLMGRSNCYNTEIPRKNNFLRCYIQICM